MQERAERTRYLIITAAAQVFEAQGFKSAAISQIAKQAEVTKGGLYFHFQSKQKLAEAVHDAAAQTLRAMTDRAREPRAGRLPMQALIDLTHDVFQRLGEDSVLRAGLLLSEDPALPPDAPVLPGPEWEELTHAVLAAPGAAPNPELPRLAVTLGRVIGGLELMSRRRREPDAKAMLASVWSLLLPGLVGADQVARYRPGGDSPRSPAAIPAAAGN